MLKTVAIWTLFFAFGIGASRWHSARHKAPVQRADDRSVVRIDFETLQARKSELDGKSISIAGRVYQDGGGNFWLVRSIGSEPTKTYALQLSAWPFKQSPPVDSWSPYMEISGIMSGRDPDRVAYDFLLGPLEIDIKDPPQGLENYGGSPSGEELKDPFK